MILKNSKIWETVLNPGYGFIKYILLLSLFIMQACSQVNTVVTTTATIPPPSPTTDQAVLQKELAKAMDDHKTDEINRLLDEGVDVNFFLVYQLTPLSAASSEGDVILVMALLDHGADISLHNKNQYGTTPLIEAALGGHTEVVRLLLEHGADINQRDKYGDPALNWATYYGHEEVVRLLIEKKADLTVIGSGGGTALNTAIARGHKGIEKLLRDAGATE